MAPLQIVKALALGERPSGLKTARPLRGTPTGLALPQEAFVNQPTGTGSQLEAAATEHSGQRPLRGEYFGLVRSQQQQPQQSVV
jgi:hypothetical protein